MRWIAVLFVALWSPWAIAATVSPQITFNFTSSSTVSLWPNSTIPGTPADSDPSAIEVGTQFQSSVAGQVVGLKFYKGSTNTGTHIGNLWTSTGTKLATVTFSGETATGWQQMNFSTPVSIAANTIYVVSYHTSVGHYASENNYFTSAHSAPPLSAPIGAGVYTYGSAPAFPTSKFLNSNYWVDVLFQSGPPPTPQLQISFTPPSPSIPLTTPLGTTVSTINVTWSDNSPFTGTLGFGPPYVDDGGIFSLSGNSLIINPSGPGLSNISGTVQNVSIVATQ